MRLTRLFVAGAAIAAIVSVGIACSSSSEDDTTQAGDASLEALSDAPSLDEFRTPDPDTGAGDPSFDDFEEPGGCGGWQADGVTLTWREPGANGTKGACEVCVTDAGGVAFKLVSVTPGTYSFESLVERLDGGTGDASWIESLAFAHNDGSDAGYAQKSGPFSGPGTYVPAEMTASTTDGMRVVMRITRSGGNDDCFLVDNVRLVTR